MSSTTIQTGVTAHHSSVSEHDNRVLASVFAAYTVTATFWLLFATAIGVLLAYKFGAPDFAPGEWLTFGRLRPIHTNATFYGWASLGSGRARLLRRRAQLRHAAIQRHSSHGSDWCCSTWPRSPARSRSISATTTAIWNIASGRGRSG